MKKKTDASTGADKGIPVPPLPAIPADELPPEIEPLRAEPVYKKDGGVIRSTRKRKNWAECLDPECPLAWDGASASGASMGHAARTGHSVLLDYSVQYQIDINPHSPNAKKTTRQRAGAAGGRVHQALLAQEQEQEQEQGQEEEIPDGLKQKIMAPGSDLHTVPESDLADNPIRNEGIRIPKTPKQQSRKK